MTELAQGEPAKRVTVPVLAAKAGCIQSMDDDDFAKVVSIVKEVSRREKATLSRYATLRARVSCIQSMGEDERANEESEANKITKKNSIVQELPKEVLVIQRPDEDVLHAQLPIATNKRANRMPPVSMSRHIASPLLPPGTSMSRSSTGDTRPLQQPKRTKEDKSGEEIIEYERDHDMDIASAAPIEWLAEEELAKQKVVQEMPAERPLSDEQQYALDTAEIQAIENEIKLLPLPHAEITVAYPVMSTEQLDEMRLMASFPQALVGESPDVLDHATFHARWLKSRSVFSKLVKSIKALNPMRPVNSIVSLL